MALTSSAVVAAIEELPVGRFHRYHLARQIAAWAAFAMCQECGPFVFDDVEAEFGLSATQVGMFASAFPAGCLVGTLASSVLLDRVGRRLPLVAGTAAAALAGALAALAADFRLLLGLRALQSAAWACAQAAATTWYAEFLPTRGRGPLIAAVSVGWPIGRGLAIGAAAGLGWRGVMLAAAAALLGLCALLAAAPASPRYLLVAGEPERAWAVVRRMYRASGEGLDEAAAAATAAPPAAAAAAAEPPRQPRHDAASEKTRLVAPDERHCGRAPPEPFAELRRRHAGLLAFAVGLFSCLAATTVLIDNYGPRVFQKLLAPGATRLPHALLLLFSAGDLAGILLSIGLVDRIGRRGCFRVGFFVQGALFALMAAAAPLGRTGLLAAIGFAATGCRCFGWEAAQMWVVEAFPTRVRATALALAISAMRLLSTATLTLAAAAGRAAEPVPALLSIAGLLGAGGLFATLLLPVETAGARLAGDD